MRGDILGEEEERKSPRGIEIIRTGNLIIYNVPLGLIDEFKQFSRKYAEGKFSHALAMLLDSAKTMQLIKVLNGEIDELRSRVNELEGKKGEIKTFGGGRL